MKKRLLIWLFVIILGCGTLGGVGYYYREPISKTAQSCWQGINDTWQSLFGQKQTSATDEDQPEVVENSTTDEDYALQLKEKQYKINTLEVAISHLQDSINKLTLANNEYSATVTDLTARKTELEAQVEELESTNATAIAEKQAEIDRLTVNITELQSQIDALDHDNSNYIEQLTELTNSKTDLENQIASLQNDIDSLNAEIASLNDTIFNLNNRIQELESANADYVAQIAELEAQIEELQKQSSAFTGPTWERKSFSKLSNMNSANGVWGLNGHIYYSDGSIQKELINDIGWVDKKWNKTIYSGVDIWKFKGNTYYSSSETHYQLNNTTGEWEKKDFGLIFYGRGVRIIDEEAYYSVDGVIYKFNNSSGYWEEYCDKPTQLKNAMQNTFYYDGDLYCLDSDYGNVYKICNDRLKEEISLQKIQSMQNNDIWNADRFWEYRGELYYSNSYVQLKWTGTQWIEVNWGSGYGIADFSGSNVKEVNTEILLVKAGFIYQLVEAA